MLKISRFAPVLAGAVLLSLAPAAMALNVNPGDSLTLTTTTLSPLFTGQTRIDSVTSSVDLIVPFPGTSVTSYKQLTVNLVTNVYRNSAGTLTFAYNLSADTFPQPDPGPPFMQSSLPSLRLSNLSSFTTDAHAENIPNAAPSGVITPAALQVSRTIDGDTLKYLFSTEATGLIYRDNTLFPPQAEASTPAVVFIQTDATDYISLDSAQVEVHSYDGRNPGGFTTSLLTFNSFAPIAGGSTPPPVVPEPMSLLTLPLALVALAWRRRRA